MYHDYEDFINNSTTRITSKSVGLILQVFHQKHVQLRHKKTNNYTIIIPSKFI